MHVGNITTGEKYLLSAVDAWQSETDAPTRPVLVLSRNSWSPTPTPHTPSNVFFEDEPVTRVPFSLAAADHRGHHVLVRYLDGHDAGSHAVVPARHVRRPLALGLSQVATRDGFAAADRAALELADRVSTASGVPTILGVTHANRGELVSVDVPVAVVEALLTRLAAAEALVTPAAV